MELLEQQAFEHQHKEFVVGSPDRSCFYKQMLEDSVNQNLDKLLVVGMKFVEFVLVAAKLSVHQYYNPNLNSLDSVLNR